ncbi:IclR family transcriptional regulator [Muricomes sp. OA1]|uniref:IclR family transcriptional regulator n=1 Tax=Hungatella hathewayi TaxID=154046 RepID=A0A3E2WZ80_9FIRM|nr:MULTISPECIES: IclR family transcriptional regulator [Clostridia]MEE0201074.1 IclR family transcriptional regulator [Muricomes sp.]MCH1973164.1 IclR family transcriptional regulator [Muricomes sp. OA1]MRM90846.1 IclR family transcriptional regulator [Faecalicatena contorta]RGC33792.1 IclR family transcriptional regulator [Hungatella hathewayi]GKH31955.1 IclR family transcriptional regulator [Faecalicatena contorta]
MAVKSAERVLKIFDLLEGSSDGLTNKDISTRLNYAPSSTIALLQTMAENGYLAVDEQKRYSLGGKLVSLGAVAASRFDIGRMATPYLKHLMQTLGETCFLGVLSQGEIVYIAKENCERTINTNAQIGSRKPVYCTGLGKAFLSFLPPEESRDIMNGLEFTAFTENTVKGVEELRKQLQEFRLQGYATDDQEIEEGLWCLAVPVYDGYHRMIAALSVSGPKERMMDKKELIIAEMLKAGKSLSRELGYQKEE